MTFKPIYFIVVIYEANGRVEFLNESQLVLSRIYFYLRKNNSPRRTFFYLRNFLDFIIQSDRLIVLRNIENYFFIFVDSEKLLFKINVSELIRGCSDP